MSALVSAGPGGVATFKLMAASVDNEDILDLTDYTDFFQSAPQITLNVDQTIKLSASFTLREPTLLRPYLDYLKPSYSFTYSDGRDPVVDQQLGLYATIIPDGTTTLQDDVGTFNADDLTSVLVSDAFDDTYNITSGTNIGAGITSIVLGSGISRTNIPLTDRTADADITIPLGTSRMDAATQLANGIGWYALGMDLDGRVSTPGATRDLSVMEPIATLGDDDLLSPIAGQVTQTTIANLVIVTGADASNAPLVSIARNDDPTSPTSTVLLGRTIMPSGGVVQAQGVFTQADLDAYAQTLLNNGRSFYQVVQFKTWFQPAMLQAHQVIDIQASGKAQRFNGRYWIRTATFGLSPSEFHPSLECNRLTSFEDGEFGEAKI